MFDQILVPVDRSLLAEQILPHAIAMARAYGSRVMLISVLDPIVESITGRPIDPWDWQLQRAEAEAYLKDLSIRFENNGVTLQTILLDGKAADQVIYHANSMGTNLIMLSSHGQGGISGWNHSSVTTKIIQQARTSVMIVPSFLIPEDGPEDLRYRRILAPVDSSQRAEFGLFTAAHLARAHEAELLIASVIKPPELPRRTPLSIQERDLVKQIVESNRAEASQYLDALKTSLDCRVDTRLMINESVPEALHKLVEQEKIDLIILNAHGLGGSPLRPYGNVTVNFLAYSTIPLLIVQDFARDRLLETPAETHANEFLGQQPTLLYESRQRLGEL